MSVWSSRSRFLPSLDIGESGARARLAFRILGPSAFESVATSLWQFSLEYGYVSHLPLGAIAPNRRGRLSLLLLFFLF
jgi:hypothetical protein